MKNLFYSFKFSFLKKRLKNKILTYLFLLLLLLPQYACNTTEPIDDLKPGRRDYTWTVDTDLTPLKVEAELSNFFN